MQASTEDFAQVTWRDTKAAIHAYSQLIGKIKACSSPVQKHWWHVALFPALKGVSTGTLFFQGHVFELRLNLIDSQLEIEWQNGAAEFIGLHGQSSSTVAIQVDKIARANGLVLDFDKPSFSTTQYTDYSLTTLADFSSMLQLMAHVFSHTRAAQRQETGPILLWPHHLDVAFLWFSGKHIISEYNQTLDNTNLEHAEHFDEQVNIGFSFGDDAIAQPYLYITAFPWQEAMKTVVLPNGAIWWDSGFNGVVFLWQDLTKHKDPRAVLIQLIQAILAHAKTIMG